MANSNSRWWRSHLQKSHSIWLLEYHVEALATAPSPPTPAPDVDDVVSDPCSSIKSPAVPTLKFLGMLYAPGDSDGCVDDEISRVECSTRDKTTTEATTPARICNRRPRVILPPLLPPRKARCMLLLLLRGGSMARTLDTATPKSAVRAHLPLLSDGS